MCLNWNSLLKFIGACFFLIFVCEVLVYYFVIVQCSWPVVKSTDDSDVKPTHVMILSDTHLLGRMNGHWFDKLRREWQMYRSFQTAMFLFKPEMIFFLGDLFDEGVWAIDKEFQSYCDRFKSMFYPSANQQLHVVVGNHDIGFHYSINKYLHQRFVDAFDAPSVKLIKFGGNNFVLVNSMAMEGDNCFLCKAAVDKLHVIAAELNCSKNPNAVCKPENEHYSRPIILQHFPMFRKSDEHCEGPDSAPFAWKIMPFEEQFHCLSRESSEMIYKLFNPRAIFTAHTHNGCFTLHKNDIPEWTVPSFSWRNRNNPSFMLVVFTPDSIKVTKCFLPREQTVIAMYIFGVIAIIIWKFKMKNALVRRWQKMR